MIRLVLYAILTQIIIVLARIRERVGKDWVIRKDRTFRFRAVKPGIAHTCCDCLLVHQLWVEGPDVVERPIRPSGYQYRLRKLSKPASLRDTGLDSCSLGPFRAPPTTEAELNT